MVGEGSLQAGGAMLSREEKRVGSREALLSKQCTLMCT